MGGNSSDERGVRGGVCAEITRRRKKNAMSCDALRVLLLALQSEKHLNKKSNAKVIYALSCLVRGNQEVMGMFVKSDGIESLAKSGLASSVIKTRVKATLLRHASVSSEEAMKRTIDAKVIDIIAEKLGANVNSQNASSSSLTDLAQEREAYNSFALGRRATRGLHEKRRCCQSVQKRKVRPNRPKLSNVCRREQEESR